MTTQPTHTSTPWTFSPMGMIFSRVITDDDGDNLVLGSMNDAQDAAFIVRAVNAHEDLLQIVKDLRNRSFDPTFKGWDLKKLDAVIAKAEAK